MKFTGSKSTKRLAQGLSCSEWAPEWKYFENCNFQGTLGESRNHFMGSKWAFFQVWGSKLTWDEIHGLLGY